MTTVQEQRLRNAKVRDMFYSIPCVRNMIAARQMDFVGKMIRGLPDRPSRNMIMACCDHKCRVGQPQTMGKNFMVENLCLLFQDIPTVQINRHGSLRSWIHEALNKNYWNQLVDRLYAQLRRAPNVLLLPPHSFHCHCHLVAPGAAACVT